MDIQMDYSLTVVARPAAALSGAPHPSAGGQPGRLAAPRKNVRTSSLTSSDRSHLQLMISNSSKKIKLQLHLGSAR